MAQALNGAATGDNDLLISIGNAFLDTLLKIPLSALATNGKSLVRSTPQKLPPADQ
jgi:hypothetical protein